MSLVRPAQPPQRPPTPPVAPAAAAPNSGWFQKPLVSTIDKYVLWSFTKNYLISLFVLISLYIVLDMVFNFDEFVQVNGRTGTEEAASTFTTLKIIADYYFFQSFRIFNFLAGIIPVVATAFTLMRMSRFNELAALLAAGVQLGRVAAPIIVASLVLNGALLFVNQEFIVPSLISKLSRDRGDLNSTLDNRWLRAMPIDLHSVLTAGRYTPERDGQPAMMEVVNVLTTEPKKPATKLDAERAVFDKKTQTWALTNGKLTTLALRNQTSEPVETYPGTGVNPETIALFVSRNDFVDLLSSARIRELLASGTEVGRVDLMRVRDARWANYLINGILVLLTIPCVLTREPTQLKTATSRIFMLIGACMATIFVTQNMAGQPPTDPQLASVWPALMAWLPIFIFGPISIWLIDRLKT